MMEANSPLVGTGDASTNLANILLGAEDAVEAGWANGTFTLRDAGHIATCLHDERGLTDWQVDNFLTALDVLSDELGRRVRATYVAMGDDAITTHGLVELVREAESYPAPGMAGDGEAPRIPMPCMFGDWLNEPPKLAPVLIGRTDEQGNDHGILRDGGLMYITGASKGGKSWMADNLAISIASGTPWLGIPCQRGRVLLCDFELMPGSLGRRLRRIVSFRSALNGAPNYGELCRSTLYPWPLRDYVAPLDQLRDSIVGCASEMARRSGCDPHGFFRMLILDPLYMVEMGDENSASDMAALFRVVRSIQHELGCAVTIVHHHAKGPSGAKAAIDRGAGSGAIGRNGDAILDVSQLFLDDAHQDRVNRNYDWAFRAPDNHGDPLGAYRLTFAGIRDFHAPRPLDVVWTCPVHSIADGRDRLSECDVIGADPLNEHNARKTRNAGNRRDSIVRIVGDALALCEMDGVEPTKTAVRTRCDWSEVGAISQDQFDKFFEERNSDWFPFRTRHLGGRKYIVERIF